MEEQFRYKIQRTRQPMKCSTAYQYTESSDILRQVTGICRLPALVPFIIRDVLVLFSSGSGSEF